MTGGSANRLMAFAEKDAIIRAEDCLSPSFALPSLTKPAMIAVIVPNCLMAGKWMIIVARPSVLLRARNLTGAARRSVRSQEKRPKDPRLRATRTDEQRADRFREGPLTLSKLVVPSGDWNTRLSIVVRLTMRATTTTTTTTTIP
ncbi:MKL/myocardin-like protein 2 [Vespula squamosa]|uniref:MKL/myocardin-like protein 2 n=1 Tax=Vespula squamosa TaxID=30214 RepID=A0ABD2C7L7_VESSQ